MVTLLDQALSAQSQRDFKQNARSRCPSKEGLLFRQSRKEEALTPCHLHALVPAVGYCARCQKAFCDRCMPSGGSPSLCKGCIARAPVASPPALPNPGRRPRSPSAFGLSGPLRLRFSLLVLGVSGLVGFLVASEAERGAQSPEEAPYLILFGSLAMAYAGWALFWCAPACWRWFWRHRSIFAGLRKIKNFGPICYLLCSLVWVFWGVVALSLLGGGIYHFVRFRRSLPSSPT